MHTYKSPDFKTLSILYMQKDVLAGIFFLVLFELLALVRGTEVFTKHTMHRQAVFQLCKLFFREFDIHIFQDRIQIVYVNLSSLRKTEKERESD